MMTLRNTLNLCILFIVFITANSAWSQGVVSGRITSSEDGEGLPGVTIAIKGTTTGTISNADGSYQLNAGSDDILIVRFIGFIEQEVAVAGRSVVDITMEVEVSALDEVVVVAYGEVRKKDLTGSVATIKGQDMAKTASVSLDQALQGQAAGVQVTQVSGRPGGQTSIRIRGSSSRLNRD